MASEVRDSKIARSRARNSIRPGSAGRTAAVESASGYPAQVADNSIWGRARGFREGQVSESVGAASADSLRDVANRLRLSSLFALLPPASYASFCREGESYPGWKASGQRLPTFSASSLLRI